MTKSFVASLPKRFAEDRYLFLLVSIVCYLAVSPFLRQFFALSILFDCFISAMLIAAVYATSDKKHFSFIGILLALPMLVSIWTDNFISAPWLTVSGNCFGIIFFIFIISRTLSYIFKTEKVTANVLYSAIVVYLLIAVAWAFIFSSMETIHPGSFSIAQNKDLETRFIFIYYSFVTITTLGYGDVSPATDTARAFAILEAAIGQIYLVVLVARLVGIHIAQSIEKGQRQH